MSRVADVPVYQQREAEVCAELYNLWRRAKLHFDVPIRLPLAELSGFVLILEENEWVCADETLNDLPVLAWVEFDDQGRDALHMPVKCKLNFYHFAASRIRAQVLVMMAEILEQRLHDDYEFSVTKKLLT